MKRGWLLVALLALAASLSVAQEAVGQVSVPVTWTGMVNATATGNTIQNVGGPGSGGLSAQRLASGDGYVEFTVADPTMDCVVSLGNAGSAGFVAGRVLHLALYGAEVREGSWTLMANTLVKPGDVFRIAVVGGSVQYSKNGTVFFTSPTPMSVYQYPLAAFASLWSFGATVTANLSSGFARVPTQIPGSAQRSGGHSARAGIGPTPTLGAALAGTLRLKY